MSMIPETHPKWGKVPPFHPKWGVPGYKNWLLMKEEEAWREENKKRRAKGLPPKPRKKIPLSIDKWVMRVNREIQTRLRNRQASQPDHEPGKKFKQLRLDKKTGTLQWVMVVVSYKPASEIFGDKLGPGGRGEDVRVVEEVPLKSRVKFSLKAISRKYRSVYHDEVLDPDLLGGWNRMPMKKGPWTK